MPRAKALLATSAPKRQERRREDDREHRCCREPAVGSYEAAVDDVWVGGVHGGRGIPQGQAVGDDRRERDGAPDDERRTWRPEPSRKDGERIRPLAEQRHREAEGTARREQAAQTQGVEADADRR